jgi:hypothetical protein
VQRDQPPGSLMSVSSSTVMNMTGTLQPRADSRLPSWMPEIPPKFMSRTRQLTLLAASLSRNSSAKAKTSDATLTRQQSFQQMHSGLASHDDDKILQGQHY